LEDVSWLCYQLLNKKTVEEIVMIIRWLILKFVEDENITVSITPLIPTMVATITRKKRGSGANSTTKKALLRASLPSPKLWPPPEIFEKGISKTNSRSKFYGII
jgi:hypothetical protein